MKFTPISMIVEIIVKSVPISRKNTHQRHIKRGEYEVIRHFLSNYRLQKIIFGNRFRVNVAIGK